VSINKIERVVPKGKYLVERKKENESSVLKKQQEMGAMYMSMKGNKTSIYMDKALRKIPVRDLPVAKKVTMYISEVYSAVDKKLLNLPALTALRAKNRADAEVTQNAQEAEKKRKNDKEHRSKIKQEVSELRKKYEVELAQRQQTDDDNVASAANLEKMKKDMTRDKLKKEKEKVNSWRNKKHEQMEVEEKKAEEEFKTAKGKEKDDRKEFLKGKRDKFVEEEDKRKEKRDESKSKELNEAQNVQEERKKREA